MAWLSGLTGKAENFLNSLDQTAAKVLHETDGTQHSTQHSTNLSQRSAKTDQSVPQSSGWAPFLSQEIPVPSSQSATKSHATEIQDTNVSATKSKAELAPVKKKSDKDEALFEFLNSPEPAEKRKSTPVSSTRHSRQSSSSSVISNKGGKNNDPPTSSSTSGSSMVHVEMPGI